MLSAPALLYGQEASPSDAGLPAIQSFSRNDYGGHSQNWAIVKDQRGIMYIGNGDGVLEYDGVSWRLIRLPNLGNASSLALDDQGRLYVGGNNELGYLAPDASGQLQYVSLIDQLDPAHREFGRVWQIGATSHGIYFRTNRALLRWLPEQQQLQRAIHQPVNRSSEGRAAPPPEEPEPDVFPLPHPPSQLVRIYAIHDVLYLQMRSVGLMTLRGDSLHVVPGSERFATGIISHMVAFRESIEDAPRLLVVSQPQGLWLYDGSTFTRFQTDPLPPVFQAAALSDGGWALELRVNGLARLDAQGRVQYILNQATGLPNQRVLYVYADDRRGLWLGLNEGLVRVETPSPLSLYQDVLGFDAPPMDLTKHQGRFYAATVDGMRVTAPEPTAEGLRTFEPVAGAVKTQSWSLLSLDETLLAGLTAGIHRIEGSQTALLPNIPTGSVWVLQASHYDSTLVYAGRQDGLDLLRKRGGQWQFAGRVKGSPQSIRFIAEEARGLLWVKSSANDLHRLELSEEVGNGEAGLFASNRIDAGLPPGPKSLHLAGPGQVVVATRQGVRRFDEETQRFVPDSTFGATFADTTRTILRIAERPQGGFWIASHTPQRQEVSLVVQEATGRYVTATSFDVSRVEFGNIPSLYPDPEQPSVVWVGTTDGLLRYDATLASEAPSTFPVLIRRVVARSDSVVYGGYTEDQEAENTVVLAYRDNELRFEFAALHYAKPELTRYQTRLDGFDEDWSAWSAEAQKDYTNLPEGNYVFQVRARNATGQTSESAGYAFVIRPPWYRAWWAYLLYLAGAGGLVALLVQFRVAQMQRKTEELEAIIDERTSELRRANELKSRFLANISHEFRTPLTLTFGPLDDLLGGRYHVDEAARPHLERARRNGSRLLRLINQLLDLSKLDAGALVLRLRRRDLAGHLRQLAALFDSIAVTQGIDYSKRIPSEPLLHVYDTDKLEKVVINLLSNAFKFTPQGRKVAIALEQQADETIRLIVADTGSGIPEEALPHLFDRFYQVEGTSTRSHEGSGIGLALVKELVELHEGTISVESTVGFGTRFTVILPRLEHDEADEDMLLVADDARPLDADQTMPVEANHAQRIDDDAPWDAAPDEAERIEHTISGSLRIAPAPEPDDAETLDDQNTVVLIVEDNPDMRHYIRAHLEDHFAILEAANGQQGLERARETVPDLVLSDVMMPVMDGLDLCAALKQEAATSHIPVVLLTAKAQVEHRIAGFESGADAYLPKPFNAEELIVRVRMLIAERERLRSLFADTTGAQADVGSSRTGAVVDQTGAPSDQAGAVAPQDATTDSNGIEEAGAQADGIDEPPPEASLPPREAAFLEQVHTLIDEHLAEAAFGVDELAEAVAMSPRQLLRKLRALTGETSTALIRRKRLEEAARLLSTGQVSVKEAAFTVGFGVETSFSRAFVQRYGMPPSVYAEQAQQE